VDNAHKSGNGIQRSRICVNRYKFLISKFKNHLTKVKFFDIIGVWR
jgi:hypothetical protein